MDGGWTNASRLKLLGDPTRWKPIAGPFLVTNEWLKLDQRTLFVERELGEALKLTDLPEGFCPQDFRWRWVGQECSSRSLSLRTISDPF